MVKVTLKQDKSVNFHDIKIANIPVRVFRPVQSEDGDKLPAVVFYHGGGWTLGSVGEIQCFVDLFILALPTHP